MLDLINTWITTKSNAQEWVGLLLPTFFCPRMWYTHFMMKKVSLASDEGYVFAIMKKCYVSMIMVKNFLKRIFCCVLNPVHMWLCVSNDAYACYFDIVRCRRKEKRMLGVLFGQEATDDSIYMSSPCLLQISNEKKRIRVWSMWSFFLDSSYDDYCCGKFGWLFSRRIQRNWLHLTDWRT